MLAPKIKMTFLGSGSAFTVGTDNYQSNILLDDGQGNTLLIDCGPDVRFSLHDLNLSYQDINHVYISHLHADHIGGLEWFGLNKFFDPTCSRPKMFISEKLVDDLWNHSLSGGMRTLQNKKVSLEVFFDVNKVLKVNKFSWAGYDFELVPVLHIEYDEEIMPCFGLMMKINQHKIFFTSDCQYAPDRMLKYYEQADIIFHDCEILEKRTGVHAHFADLSKLPKKIKAKMWLYHYNPVSKPDYKSAGFLGFVKKHQVFEF